MQALLVACLATLVMVEGEEVALLREVPYTGEVGYRATAIVQARARWAGTG